ncbi:MULTISPECIES: PEP-CTERM sorting domain-containing protein [unclassified Roseateles]|uniref:PEP-CTERM sorting domain-containing protein n=1 Tax=unclassified Roseateles TaxID=2626991 RepID=UPI0006F27B01|nr:MULTISPECIES: PEP-CTERM sorting domain-containing protein [unclassified Roseateles]KQW41231.1 hypothetical protein ASC81_23425 [Pelomonas sp. Root405]KRA68002.1 hypothetical protein ASD88_21405 [Pelomonas sp. Root662]
MTLQTHTLSKVAAALLICGLAAHAHASGTVVLDTYQSDISWLDGWPNPLAQGQDIAIPFALADATSIQSILTSIERTDGSGGVTVGILARGGALPSGANWLYSTHLANPVVNTLLTPSGWALDAGSYWLVAVPDSGFIGQWQSATSDPTANWARSTSTGAWVTVDSPFIGMPAARITVTSAVPEPSTYGLMFAGGLLLAAAARRRKSNASQQG